MAAKFDFSMFASSKLFQDLVVIDEFVSCLEITFNFGGVSSRLSQSILYYILNRMLDGGLTLLVVVDVSGGGKD